MTRGVASNSATSDTTNKSQTDDLDCLLGELNALELQFQTELDSFKTDDESTKSSSCTISPAGGATIIHVSSPPVQPHVASKKLPPSVPPKPGKSVSVSVSVADSAARPVPPPSCRKPAHLTGAHQSRANVTSSASNSSARDNSVSAATANINIINNNNNTTSDKERTASPGGGSDSAFSDNASVLSSDSSVASGGTTDATMVAPPPQHQRSLVVPLNCQEESLSVSSPDVQRADAIRDALQRMRAASVRRLYVKVFAADDSTKSVLLDEHMQAGSVALMMADKKHVSPDAFWALVERLPALGLEREYEEHESVVDNLLLWTSDSCNRLEFLRRPLKHDLFVRPERYLLGENVENPTFRLDDTARHCLIKEKFSTGSVVPNLEGSLWLKVEGKKAWKRHIFAVRESGLYYLPKGKYSSDHKKWHLLANFQQNQIYTGFGWRERLRAPTDYGLAIKHGQVQNANSKHIHYLCVDKETEWRRWHIALRLLKHGRQLLTNYEQLLQRLSQLDQAAVATSGTSSSSASQGSDLPDGGTLRRKPASSATALPVCSEEDLSALPPPPSELLCDPLAASSLASVAPAGRGECRRVRFCEGPADRRVPQSLTAAGCQVLPPPEFLSHLRSVMHRRWTVAEKCRHSQQLPHQVLGFRDERSRPSSKEREVGQWLRQHYGAAHTQPQSILKRSDGGATRF